MTTWVLHGGDDVEVRSTGLGGAPLLVPGATIGLYTDLAATVAAVSPADVRVVGGGTLTLPLTVTTYSQFPLFEARSDATLYYQINGGPVGRLYPNPGPALATLAATDLGAIPTPLQVRAYATGNGTTDDRAAILAAEAIAVAAGRALDFGGPEMTYAISAPLSLAANRRWFAQGATLKAIAGFPNEPLVQVTGSNATLRGLRLDGNASVATSASSLVDDGGNTLSGLTLADLTMVNGRTYSILMYGPHTDLTIDNNTMTDCARGISLQSQTGGARIKITRNRIRNCTSGLGIQINTAVPLFTQIWSSVLVAHNQIGVNNAALISAELNYIDQLVCTGNIINGPGLRGFSLGTLTNSTITGNTILNQGIYGIELNHLNQTVVTGNTIRGCQSGMGGQVCVDLLVADNVVHTTDVAYGSPHGVWITTAGSKRVTVRDNLFVDIAGHAVRVLDGPEDVTVVGNVMHWTSTFAGSNHAAVSIWDWARGLVEDNMVYSAIGTGGTTSGFIQISAAANEVLIKGNTIRGATGAVLARTGIAIGAVAPTKLRITGNDVFWMTHGINTASATGDDVWLRNNRTENCTNATTLKSTHLVLDSAASADLQTFAAAGTFTWTKPTGAKKVTAIVVAGGAGGGGGRQDVAGTARVGGGGGGGGARNIVVIPAASLGATESVTVGAGGVAGTAATGGAAANGGNGGNGGASLFGNHVRGNGGNGGVGGQTGAGGTGGGSSQGGSGGASPTSGGVGGNGNASTAGAPGGGAGGGISAANAVFSGGAGADGTITNLTGGAGGTAGGAGGTGTASAASSGIPACGGGGGASSITAAAGNGGAGGAPGGPGGGGGASVVPNNSGAGGAGGAGLVVVITEF